MRKILLIIIIVLLIVLGYTSLTNGIKIDKFEILSVKKIQNESQNLKAKIEELNTIIDINYPKKYSELKTASSNMETQKNEYLKYTNLSSDTDIINARTEKSYTIEFLWTKLGTHARKEGVNLTFEIVSSGSGANNINDIRFKTEGSYIGITNFIYAIENDTDLNFRIHNFKLLPYKEEILQGTFTVRNIAIQGNTSTQAVTSTQNTTDTTDTTTNTTTMENTTDTSTDNTNITE